MDKKDTVSADYKQHISREPFPNSKKHYATTTNGLKVPFRGVKQDKTTINGKEKDTTNPEVFLYDTSGPYTDPKATIDFNPRAYRC